MKNNKENVFSCLSFQHFALPCLLLAVFCIYYQALPSRFLLDDYYNLSDLSLIDANGIAYYVFGGFSGPSGRPISLLSFAIQYQDWPDNPFAFKLINLVIHLLNGVLIWFICKRLAKAIIQDKQYQLVFVVLTTGFWLLHPMQFSTVMYVVQRMTQISTFFILSGVLSYLWARDKYFISGSHPYLILMSLFVIFFTLFAILGKENGILLPLFIIVIEMTLLNKDIKPAVWKKWATLFLVLPLIILFIYLIFNIGETLQSYHARQFTLSQRLLTECTILLNYLKDLIIPSYGAFTLYHDDFPIAKSLFSPFYTFFSVISIILLVIVLIILRKKFLVLSFTFLWFFSGHLLESTFLNLELYFEHRNYLPSLGIMFGISWLMIKLLIKIKSRLLSLTPILIYTILILTLSVTEAKLWAHPVIQISEWARLHPTSVRALNDLANLHTYNNEYERAIKVYEQINSLRENDIYPLIQKLYIENCKQKKQYDENTWHEILSIAGNSNRYGLTVIAALDTLILDTLKKECEENNTEELVQLLSALINNNKFSPIRAHLYEFTALLKLENAQYDEALDYIRLSINKRPRLSMYIHEIRILKLMGRHDEADELIEVFKEKMYKDPRIYMAYRKVLESLQEARY